MFNNNYNFLLPLNNLSYLKYHIQYYWQYTFYKNSRQNPTFVMLTTCAGRFLIRITLFY